MSGNGLPTITEDGIGSFLSSFVKFKVKDILLYPQHITRIVMDQHHMVGWYTEFKYIIMPCVIRMQLYQKGICNSYSIGLKEYSISQDCLFNDLGHVILFF